MNTTWTEKYRPSTFNKIILDETNKNLFNSILDNGYFPNMLFYIIQEEFTLMLILNVIIRSINLFLKIN